MKRSKCAVWCALLAVTCIFALPAHAWHIGVCIYDGTDTFMGTLREGLENYAREDVQLTMHDSRNNQNLQNEQVAQMLEAGVDALILNPVDRTAAGYLIEIAKQKEVPLVFINREPLREDIDMYDRAYYVGASASESGELSGQIMAQYFLDTPGADKNGDGIIQYVLLKGEPGHQDAELRTQYALKPLQDAGFDIEKLQEDTGKWQRILAQDKMAGFLAAHGDRIECVIANNDDMALGAIDALKAAGYFSGGRFMPVVGVDATPAALEALEQGSLLGTVHNDGESQARAALDLALLLAEGKTPNATNYAYALTDERFVWIQYQSVTRK